MRIVDNVIALRIVFLLVTPIENTEAFKLGLIDADGKTIKKATTPEEKNATSMLHRLCWNLKRIISLVPGGSTKIGSLAAAYLLMREAYEEEWDEEQLTEAALLRFPALCEAESDLDEILDQLSEDAPANATGAAVSTDTPTKIDKGVIARRKKYKTIIDNGEMK